MQNNKLHRCLGFIACCCLVTVGYFWTVDPGLKAADYFNRTFSGVAIGFILALPVCLLDWAVRAFLRRVGIELTAGLSFAFFIFLVVTSAYGSWMLWLSCSHGSWCFGI